MIKDTLKKAMIRGRITPYDCCSITEVKYNPERFRYIGSGMIYQIDGEYIPDSTIYYFWVDAQK